MFIEVEVRPSRIFGDGLYPLRGVPRGTILCSFTIDSQLLTEDQYVDAIRDDAYLIVRTGTRYAGRYFTYSQDPRTDLNFFNHSFTPNLLVHCGIVIALTDIPAGQELTVDYRYLVDDTDVGLYNDAISGKPIRGFGARQTLLHTSKTLVALLETLGDDWGG